MSLELEKLRRMAKKFDNKEVSIKNEICACLDIHEKIQVEDLHSLSLDDICFYFEFGLNWIHYIPVDCLVWMKDMKDSQRIEKLKVFGRSLIVGGSAAAISKTIVAPMERFKIVLQVQKSHPDIDPSKLYTGIFDCAKRLITDQPKDRKFLVKLMTWYRGNTVNVVRYFPMQAINFAVKGRFRDLFYGRVDQSQIGFWGDMWRSCLSGGLAGIVGLSLVYPLDFARTRMTSDVGSTRKYKGVVDCARQVVAKEGVFALYKGFAPSVCGIFPYRAAYFGFYDVAKKYVMKGHPEDYGFFAKWAISQTTSVMSQFVAYPFDTVRRRMMLSTGSDGMYKNSMDCFRKMWKEEGFLAFYHGAGANAIRATGCALCLVFYDSIGKFLFCDKDYGGH